MIKVYLKKWFLWWQNWSLSLQREAVETQYRGYLDKLTPMRREHELRQFVAKTLKGFHVHSNPERKVAEKP